MKFSKKVMSVALCTILLSGGSLATFTNIAHADSNNAMCSRSISQSWTETFNLKLQRKSGFGKAYLKIDLIQNNGKLTLGCNYQSVPSLSDYKFDDTYLFGLKTSSNIYEKFELNNNNIGAFKNGNIASEVKDFIDKFNSLNVSVKEGLVLLYAHGKNYDDTLTFSGKDITRPTTSKNYSNGYKSRGIDKWTHGFQLKENGIYETSFIHNR